MTHSATSAALQPAAAPPDGVEDAALLEVLDLVEATCGTPFHGYRRATVVRRIRNRMIAAGVSTLRSYAALVRSDPGEAARLLERITVKVSRLWRNARSVAALRQALSAAPGRPLVAWSAGCGRGEEAYTIGILLAEAAGGAPWRVLGTDVDPGALAEARRGRYAPDALAEVPEDVARRHLEPPDAEGLRRVGGGARAGVAFRLHDLVVAGGPPDRCDFDLVACRNVLIYLEVAARRRVEGLLAEALAPGGLLWLGEAEWPSAELARRLAVVDGRGRLFRSREARA